MTKAENSKKPDAKDLSFWIPSSTTHPLDVAVVYESPELLKCGHRLILDRLLEYLDSSSSSCCPLCGAKIAWIRDAAAAASDFEEASSMVMFKYGKQTYQLSVQRKATTYSWWWNIFSTTKTSCTAQERITRALHLITNSMKILSKGKVLYPPNHSTITDEEEVSNRLLQQSKRDWNTSATKKASLVVMGTRTGHEFVDKKKHTTRMLSETAVSLFSFVYHWAWDSMHWLYDRLVRRLPNSTTNNDHED